MSTRMAGPSVGALGKLGLGDDEGAAANYERALAIQESSLGPDHPALVRTLTNLGNVHVASGDPEGARSLYERALTIQESSLGPDHANVAEILGDLGRVELDAGRPTEAVALLERAVAIHDASEGKTRSARSDRFSLAQALVESGGDETRAVELARTAAESWREAGVDDAGQLEEIAAFVAAHDASP